MKFYGISSRSDAQAHGFMNQLGVGGRTKMRAALYETTHIYMHCEKIEYSRIVFALLHTNNTYIYICIYIPISY